MKKFNILVVGLLSVFLAALFVFPQSTLAVDPSLNAKGLRIHNRDVTTLREMKTRYITFQQYDYSCGAAVISTLLTYYFGEPATEKQVISGLFRRANMQNVLKRKAFSLLDMKRFALARGYKAIGYRMDFEFLVGLKQPVIIPVVIRGYHHFVIFKGLVADRVFVADPAFGNYTMRVGRFLSIWSGGIGFILKRQNPRGPLTKQDLARQSRFMTGPTVRIAATDVLTRSVTEIPGKIQTIVGPSPVGGSFLDFFGIQVPPSSVSTTPGTNP